MLLRSKLAEHLVDKQDRGRFSPFCGNHLERVETIGGPPPSEELLSSELFSLARVAVMPSVSVDPRSARQATRRENDLQMIVFFPTNDPPKKRPAQNLAFFGFSCYTRSTAVGMADCPLAGLKQL